MIIRMYVQLILFHNPTYLLFPNKRVFLVTTLHQDDYDTDVGEKSALLSGDQKQVTRELYGLADRGRGKHSSAEICAVGSVSINRLHADCLLEYSQKLTTTHTALCSSSI